MSATRKPITPQPSRWKPNPDPASIVIPGLDTDASTVDQIEQIEQLITIKLQNIDENFSKIHNVLANKLLPAVKRYAVGTEPVREAAKFWTSFYEQAAQIRIPTFDDYSTVNEVPSEHEETQEQGEGHTVDGHQTTHPMPEIYETSVVNSETSFLPRQGAFSSTPAMARQGPTDHSYATQGSDPSWTPSMESPLVRLNREINNFANESTDDSIIPSTSAAARYTPATEVREDNESADFTFQPPTTSEAPRSEKGKGKAAAQPLLKEVLRHTLYSASDNSSFENNTVRNSPFKFRAKPKTPTIDKSLNPYLRSDTTATTTSNWSGVVDLRDPSVLTPQRGRSGKFASKNATTPYADDDDDSFDGLPPGMSPPVLMSPARPPRSSAELGLLKLGQTPARDASMRIQLDLLREEQLKSGKGGGGGGRRLSTFPKPYESSMSTAPTPPSLSRYSLNNRHDDYSTSSSMTKDSSLESMIRHIRSGIEPNVGMTPGMGSTPGLRIRPRERAPAQAQVQEQPRAYDPTPPRQYQQQRQYSPSPPSEPATPMYGQQHMHMHHHQQQDIDSDSDSLDEINNTAHPSAAFLMASQGVGVEYDDDDSFGSSNHSSDSLNDEVVSEGIVPVHPFASAGTIEDDGFDDSFDDDDDRGGGGYQEETVFGVHPAQRMYDARQSDGHNLRMLGDNLLQDTIGIGSQMAASGRVEESPTPASWAH